MLVGRLPWSKKVKTPHPEEKKEQDNPLFGTYIKVTPNHSTQELIAIQDWIKEQDSLTYGSMPVADILGRAKRDGVAYVIIDITGYVTTPNTSHYKPHVEFRELTFYVQPKVVNYHLEPTTIQVLGKNYNKKEVEALLKQLEPK